MSGHAVAGYSGKPVWQKLGLRAGQAVRVEDAPADYAGLVGLAGSELQLLGARAGFEFAHVFASRRMRLEHLLPRLARRLPATGTLWISWPKKTSSLASDISEDSIREIALPLGLVDVKVCAIDADWSALKLVWRKEHRAKMQPAPVR